MKLVLLVLILSGAAQAAPVINDRIDADSKPIARGSRAAAAGAACLKSVNEARAWARAELGDQVPWIDEAIECDVAADTGCGSMMDHHDLQFLTGEKGHCGQAAFIPAYVYHEWAHGLNHEYAGVQSQALDEAMADTFAIYLTGDPRFGEGMYLDREHSWQRDLSERKIYDGPTKQLYTQSETLSGAWWEFRVRLVGDYGEADGARLAKDVYFQHLRELNQKGDHPTLVDDYGMARAAVLDLASLDAIKRAKVSCELSNAFQDHGFEAAESGCARAPLVTDVEAIVALAQAAGQGLAKAEAPLADAGRTSAFPVSIPDKATLTFRFEIDAPAGAKVAAVLINDQIDYSYSDDLLLTVVAPDQSASHDVYKGEEELAVPTAITDRYKFAGASAAGVWTVKLRDDGSGIGGAVRALSLTVLLK